MTEQTKKKPKKFRMINPYGRLWEKLANELARDFAPNIRPCRECGNPVINGYCCTRCGSTEP